MERLALCEARRDQTYPRSLGRWDEEKLNIRVRKRLQGRVRDEETSRVGGGANSGGIKGEEGTGAWGAFTQMEVNCHPLLAGPIGEVVEIQDHSLSSPAVPLPELGLWSHPGKRTARAGVPGSRDQGVQVWRAGLNQVTATLQPSKVNPGPVHSGRPSPPPGEVR